MSNPIAYVYEADTHCVDCAIERFGQEPSRPWVREDARDAEGNTPGALAPWDDFGPDPVVCGTCRAIFHAGSGPVSIHVDSLAHDECSCDNCLADDADRGDA